MTVNWTVKSEVESSLLSATALHSSYNRILLTLPIESRATSDELLSTRTELQATLSTLLYDISELDHVVCVLEEDLSASSPGPTASWKQNTKSKFGVSLEEVKKGRRWLAQVQQQVKVCRRCFSLFPQLVEIKDKLVSLLLFSSLSLSFSFSSFFLYY